MAGYGYVQDEDWFYSVLITPYLAELPQLRHHSTNASWCRRAGINYTLNNGVWTVRAMFLIRHFCSLLLLRFHGLCKLIMGNRQFDGLVNVTNVDTNAKFVSMDDGYQFNSVSMICPFSTYPYSSSCYPSHCVTIHYFMMVRTFLFGIIWLGRSNNNLKIMEDVLLFLIIHIQVLVGLHSPRGNINYTSGCYVSWLKWHDSKDVV